MYQDENDRLFLKQATSEAEQELVALGFEKAQDGSWIQKSEDPGLSLTVKLPQHFPYVLPELSIDRNKLPRRIPHVELNGKICIALDGSVLLDSKNPRTIVRQAVEKAQKTVKDGLSGALDIDFRQEFLAYWRHGPRIKALWTIPIPQAAQEVCMRRLAGGDYVVDAAVEGWVEKAWGIEKPILNSFFLSLESGFDPPDFNEKWTNKNFLKLINLFAKKDDKQSLINWLFGRSGLNFVFMAMPTVDKNGVIIVAVAITLDESKKPTLHGLEYLAAHPDGEVDRIEVNRADPDFLLPRGGADVSLRQKSVVIVGCGAIGSHTAKMLAQLGVGSLRLVDPEVLGPENIYRHLLGASHLRKKKVIAISEELSHLFPHIKIEVRSEKIENILVNEPAFVQSADIVLLATGDETLELHLNVLLKNRLPRVHAWLEPLGIGGHVIAAGVSVKGGCFECLYEYESFGLTNLAAFVQPGQEFARTFAGCGGRFFPFSALDAIRTATEASRLVADILLKHEKENVLISWYGNPEIFTQKEYKLSDRAKIFKPGEMKRKANFERIGCSVCG